MKENARAIFVIDPEKYMTLRNANAWRLIVDNLPDRIIFIFAQRPDDVLANSAEFGALANVVRIPKGSLDVLDQQAVDDLVQARAPDLSQPTTDVRAALTRYQGHPYAVSAALSLLAEGAAITDLPADPTATGVAAAQWRRLCDELGEDAIALFQAFAVLEVAVPDEVIEAVSGIDPLKRRAILSKPFVTGLIREVGRRRRIYHRLLVDHISAQLIDVEFREYHRRAIDVYRQILFSKTQPDALAAARLPEHLLAAEGPQAFVDSLISECLQPLLFLGLIDAALAMCYRALEYVSSGSAEEAVIAGNLGLIFLTRGDLDEAEKMLRKSHDINEKFGRLEGMAHAYGNLGLIYRRRGDLDEAEKMHRKSLEIEMKLGQLDGMACEYGNLGIIYKTRGDLDEAEKMYRKALEIDEKLGRLEGIATAYGNLGTIFQTRGDLEGAERMYRKGLEIDEKLGRLEGMAADYGNLGLTFQMRGDLHEARKLWTKARDLFAKIGMPQMVERVQGWVDDLPDAGEDRS